VAYIRGASGQSADLLDVIGKGAGDVNLPIATFGASGNILFQNAIDSATAFRVQNLNGNNYLLVNTSGASVSLGDTGIASTVQIGNTTGAVAQTINIGNNATGSSTSTVVIGSTIAGVTTLQSAGGVAVSTLGTANTVSYLCRNGSNIISTCQTAATGSAFLQGGNSFGATAVLGTNDSNSLTFETNNVTQATIAVGGATTFKNSTDSTTAFQVLNTAGTQVLGVDTSNLQVNTGNLQSIGSITLQNGQGASIQLRTVSSSSTGLTLSGNEITDATRATNIQGDGRQPPDSSTGIWEGTTNLVTNGGFETDITGWSNSWGGSTPFSRSTTRAKFGTASVKYVRPDTLHGSEGLFTTLSSPASTTAYTASAWIYVDPGSTESVQINFVEVGGSTPGSTISSTVAPGAGWIRVSATRTTGTSPTSLQLQIDLSISTGAVGNTFWADGVQLEQKPIATPYVETNGATASRSAARVQGPTTAMTNTKGWAAFRVRPAWGATTGTGATDPFLMIKSNGTNYIDIFYDTPSQKWCMGRNNGTYNGACTAGVQSFAAGSLHTVIGEWDANNLMISIDGSPLSAATTASTNVVTPNTFDIGNVTNQFDGDILWAAVGDSTTNSTITDADAAALYRYGNSDPTLASLQSLNSGAANPVFAWDGEASQYTGTNSTPVSQSGITLDDATLYRVGADQLETNSSIGINIQPSNGVLQLAAATTAAGGIYFGTDTDLYRSAAATLSTDNTFSVLGGSGVYVVRASSGAAYRTYLSSTDTQPALQVNGSGTMNWGPGGLTATDTSLSRSAANVLTLSGTLILGSTPATADNSLKAATTAYVDRTAPVVIAQTFTDSGSTAFWPSTGTGYGAGGGGLWTAQAYSSTAGVFIFSCEFFVTANTANGNRAISIGTTYTSFGNNYGAACSVANNNTASTTLNVSTAAASGNTINVYFRRVLPTAN
jgi:hypothetical protein